MLATRKGVRREAGSEGSVVQSRDSTYSNRIRGRSGWGERAEQRKAHIHQDPEMYIRRACGESC